MRARKGSVLPTSSECQIYKALDSNWKNQLRNKPAYAGPKTRWKFLSVGAHNKNLEPGAVWEEGDRGLTQSSGHLQRLLELFRQSPVLPVGSFLLNTGHEESCSTGNMYSACKSDSAHKWADSLLLFIVLGPTASRHKLGQLQAKHYTHIGRHCWLFTCASIGKNDDKGYRRKTTFTCMKCLLSPPQ